MIGAILLIIAIILYFKPKYRYLSYFLYLSFMMRGLNLWTDAITGLKTMDMAVIYTFVISAYLVFAGKWKIPKWPIRKFYIALVIMVVLCVFFSYVHYNLSPYQILQGGRNYLLLFSLPVLLRIKDDELKKTLNILLFFCALTSILYILQIVLRRPLMPYGDFTIDSSTGLPRFYNSPLNLTFFLVLTFLLPKFFKGNIWIYRALFFIAVIATQGRTFIVSVICTILLATMLQGKLKRIGTSIAFLFIIITPFYGIINDRFEGGGGTSDFTDIMNGNYKFYESGQDGGTMVYRFAWVYERYDYMRKQPLGELLFGLGLVSDSQPWVTQHYKFSVGLVDPDTGEMGQLSTPDISYGNLLTKLGLLGCIVYLAFVLSLTIYVFRKRKSNVLILLSAAIMITSFLTSFSGSGLSQPASFALVFAVLSLLSNKKTNIKYMTNESSTH